MVVFGIDPGSTVTGFGVVARRRGRLHHVASGCIRTSTKTPVEQRLVAIHAGLLEALAAQPVDEVAIEAIFAHKSSESAIRLGQARGVALLAAAQLGFCPVSYNAMTVKRSIGAHGRADKKGVARMVGMLLGSVPDGPADITDALAIAITHLNHSRAAAAGLRR
jgi:crossover junction endodeoxyribonuclease RuvC